MLGRRASVDGHGVIRSQPSPSDDELRATFEELLAGPPADGSSIPSDTGLDEQTLTAIERAWAGSSPTLIETARHELAMQLDGTHAEEGDADAMAIFHQATNT